MIQVMFVLCMDVDVCVYVKEREKERDVQKISPALGKKSAAV